MGFEVYICNVKLRKSWSKIWQAFIELTSYDVDLVFNDSSRSTNVFDRPCL